MSFKQPYVYYSSLVRRAVDAEGIVHDVIPGGDHVQYSRRTRCERGTWANLEPVSSSLEELVVTCIECIGARTASPEAERLLRYKEEQRYRQAFVHSMSKDEK